jgi:hypothetical protein
MSIRKKIVDQSEWISRRETGAVRNARPSRAQAPSAAWGLERNNGGNLECVALESRSALEFAEILNPDAHTLLG